MLLEMEEKCGIKMINYKMLNVSSLIDLMLVSMMLSLKIVKLMDNLTTELWVTHVMLVLWPKKPKNTVLTTKLSKFKMPVK